MSHTKLKDWGLPVRKILFYINAIHEGGAERVMVNLASSFAHDGYEIVLVTSYHDTWEYPLDSKVKRLSLEEREIVQSRIKRNVSRIKKLRRICKEEKPDVVVSFMAEPNFRAILALFGLETKVIVSVRNDPNKEYAGIIGRIVGKVLLPMADGCVFQTRDARDWFPMRLQKKSRIIYNAVKTEFYKLNRSPVWGRVVTCGRLVPQKNHALLIDAFTEAAKDISCAHLHIYGEGNLREALQQQIVALGMEDRITLKGNTGDVAGVLKEASVFVLSSDYEGMPNALMEALAAGVPSISTDCPCGGPKMLVNDGENGLLVSVGDKAAMTNAIRKLLLDRTMTASVGITARKMAEQYQPERVYAQWKDYLNHVAQR